jgi:L-amino acid N-acyltransferase YncA
MPGFAITPATLADAPQITAIYGHHVLHGTATFELEPPSADDMARRMATVLDAGSPWLAARSPGRAVIGYAYAAQFLPRAGYRHACEDSVYIAEVDRGRGIGTALLAALIAAGEACGFRQMIAKIAGTEPASVALHARAGFVEAGRLRSVGRKHGQWLDVLFMQRSLGPGDTAPPAEEP